MGRATLVASCPQVKSCRISIHALRGEGDSRAISDSSNRVNFNPRPPWGGRHEDKLIAFEDSLFQSTPSVGRATIFSAFLACSFEFQSTPSVGRATLDYADMSATIKLFQSTPSVGRATGSSFTLTALTLPFQSTPSVGRATYKSVLKDTGRRFQSTPSVGRATTLREYNFITNFHFNPRPPWGGRHGDGVMLTATKGYFNPRPPWGGRLKYSES